MSLICKNDNILIRTLEKNSNDIQSLYEWLNNKNVYKYYGDSNEQNFDFVKQKYENKIDDKTMFPCIIEVDKKSVGYIQFYNVNYENYDLTKQLYEKIASKNDNAFAIDIFIGEDDYRDKGIGTKVIKLLIKALFEKYNADVILIDPKTDNYRAIACYKKCGFKECFIVKNREEKDGIKYDNLIMSIHKQVK